MKLKLDENLSRHLKPALNDLGHDVLTAADEGLLSRPDVEVAACAARENRILLTLDVEFADLRKHPQAHIQESCCFAPYRWDRFQSTVLSNASSERRTCLACRDA